MTDSGAVPVVVDCDPGIDDAVALALVAASPELDLRAVTTVRGNVPVDLCTRNARRVLAACGRAEVPVAGGATRPLVRANPEYPRIHGTDGLGDVHLTVAAGEAESLAVGDDGRGADVGIVGGAEPGADEGATAGAARAGAALDLLAAVLEPAAPGEVTVIALAPLTNLALLLDLRPDLADRIGTLAVMGATIDRGNVTPFAEFNVWADPEAAHRVLVEGELASVRLFTLAATRKAALNEDQRLELATWSPAGALLAEMILGYDDQVTGAGWPLHDAMVVAALVDPTLVTLRPAAAIGVDTGTGSRRGHTAFDWDGEGFPAGSGAAGGEAITAFEPHWKIDGEPPPPAPTLEVAIDADPERFRALLRERIARL
jgi:pyrimidine-specific ribonucleoside hydrolase